MQALWLERYNSVLRSQPTNNRSFEMQIMRLFHKDNARLQLVNEARLWPLSVDLLSDPSSGSTDVTYRIGGRSKIHNLLCFYRFIGYPEATVLKSSC